MDFLGLGEHPLPPPMDIGFGSITAHDSTNLLDIIVHALSQTGYRALLAGFHTDARELPRHIYRIADIPHDWLFSHGQRKRETMVKTPVGSFIRHRRVVLLSVYAQR